MRLIHNFRYIKALYNKNDVFSYLLVFHVSFFLMCIEGLVDFEVVLFALLIYYLKMELNFVDFDFDYLKIIGLILLVLIQKFMNC